MSITIHILAVDDTLTAHAIRAAAEYWGAAVSVTWVGNGQQVVDVLGSKPAHDLVIIAGHGDERGLLLPELAEQIKDRYPYSDVITPADFAEFVQFANNIVVNLSCLGGMPALAQVFLNAGARAYIGPVDYPDGSAALMYVFDFLYTFIHGGQQVDYAHRGAAAHADDRQQFVVYPLPNAPR